MCARIDWERRIIIESCEIVTSDRLSQYELLCLFKCRNVVNVPD